MSGLSRYLHESRKAVHFAMPHPSQTGASATVLNRFAHAAAKSGGPREVQRPHLGDNSGEFRIGWWARRIALYFISLESGKRWRFFRFHSSLAFCRRSCRAWRLRRFTSSDGRPEKRSVSFSLTKRCDPRR